MIDVRVISTLAMTSGIPEDSPTNVWHFTAADETDATIVPLLVALQTFYKSLETYYPDTVARTGHIMRAYNLADEKPRAPFRTATWNFASAPAGETLPSEVSLCMSFQGDRISGEPQARRRGRIYLGPFDVAYTIDGRPDPDLVTAVVDAGQDFWDASETDVNWTWRVYSPSDNAMVQVTDGWVDNAWDIQRRRGIQPTSRAAFGG